MRWVVVFFALLFGPVVCGATKQALDKVVAVVNENVITQHELDTQLELMRKQMQAKNIPLPPEDVLRKQVLQHLIDIDLQLQLAKRNDITIDATELDDTIAKIAEDNKLTMTQFREAVAREGMTWENYRENLQKEMIIARLQQRAVGHEIEITPKQVDDYIKHDLANDKSKSLFHVQNIVIPLPDAPSSQQISGAKQKAQQLLAKIQKGADFSLLAVAESSGDYALEGGDLGERHLAELPEIFEKQVKNMQVGEVSGPIRTGNGFQLIKLVGIRENEIKHKIVKTHVRHILVKQDVNMTNDEALKQVHNLYEQLKSGKDFAHMAKMYSLDAKSAANGGDLGWVVAEELVKPFSEAMADLPLHTVSKPVKTQYGWHLIEVLERKEVDDSEAFKRQQVRMFLQQRKFNEVVQTWKQQMHAQSYINVMDKNLA